MQRNELPIFVLILAGNANIAVGLIPDNNRLLSYEYVITSAASPVFQPPSPPPVGAAPIPRSLSLAGTHQHRKDAAQRAASCSILFSAGKTCVRLSCGTGLSGEAQHFPGLHLYLPGLSACVSPFSTTFTTSGGNRFSNFSALRQRDSNAEMWARC